MNSLLFLFCLPGEDYLAARNYREAARYCELEAKTEPSRDTEYRLMINEFVAGRTIKAFMGEDQVHCGREGRYYYFGVESYRQADFAAARRYFRLLRAENRGRSVDNVRDQVVDYYLGLIGLKQGMYDSAGLYFARHFDAADAQPPRAFIAGVENLTRARQKFLKGEYAGAIAIYEEVKGFFGYRELGLAMSFEKIGDYQAAEQYYEAVAAGTDDGAMTLVPLFRLGMICGARKEYAAALAYFQKALAIEPAERIKYQIGLCYSGAGQYDSAAYAFSTLADSVDEYLFYKGRTDYFRGQWGVSEERLLRHLENFPGSQFADRTLYILGTIDFKRGDNASATNFYSDLIDRYPLSSYAASAMKGIADAQYSAGNFKAALASYKNVGQYLPSDRLYAESKIRIYESLFGLKRYATMVAALRRFVDDHADSAFAQWLLPVTRLRIAKILAGEREYYTSLAELDRLIGSYPQSPLVTEALAEKAAVAKNIGDEDEVKRSYHEIIARRDSKHYYPYALNELAAIYVREARHDSAIFFYNRLLEVEDSKELAIYEIAKVYETIGQYQEAETMIDRLISEFPGSVLTEDAYRLKARCAQHRGDFSGAAAILGELTAKTGDKADIQMAIGDIFSELKDYRKALEHYRQACELFKQDRNGAAQALVRAGDVSLSIGDRPGARDYYLRASLIAQSAALKDEASRRLTELSDE